MAFMAWIQVWPKMALKEGSSITMKGTSGVTSPIETGNMTSPSKVVWVPLKPIRTLLGFRGYRLVP